MRVLIVKTSSLGDVIHTLPAVTDAKRQNPEIQFDWLVEQSFAEIPTWHPAIQRVIPVQYRQWRKHIWHSLRTGVVKQFIQDLRQDHYDLIIDAQGLIKSACMGLLARGKRAGLARNSAREGLASLTYQYTYPINPKQHAVEKVRDLFASALSYTKPPRLHYGIDHTRLKRYALPEPYVMFLHGTTWPTKHWPDRYWMALAQLMQQAGIPIVLTWGNDAEKKRAQAIAYSVPGHCVTILPKLSLSEITDVIAHARAIAAVDTGLGHIAAMMNVPTVSIYGPTFPGYTGAYGQDQVHLTPMINCHPCFLKSCPKLDVNKAQGAQTQPCFATISPEEVAEILKQRFVEPVARLHETA